MHCPLDLHLLGEIQKSFERSVKDIQQCLLETLLNWRDWILQMGPTISQIFQEYPRLLDYNG